MRYLLVVPNSRVGGRKSIGGVRGMGEATNLQFKQADPFGKALFLDVCDP